MQTITKKIIISILANFIFCLSVSAINDALKIKISKSSSSSDETVVRFLQGATNGFDGNFDAYKMFSASTTSPTIYSNIDSVTHMSINALPSLNALNEIELFVKIKVAGQYTLQSIELGTGFSGSAKIVLEDKETGLLYDFRNGKSVSLMMNATSSDASRFKIHFSPEMIITANSISCNGANNGNITLIKSGNHNWNYELKNNSTLNSIFGNNIDETAIITNLAAGTYTLYTESNITLLDSTTINITEPAAIVSNFVADNISAFLSAATISFTNNSSNFSSCSWNFGDGVVSDSTSPVHQYLSTGTYNVSLTVSNMSGCSSTSFQTINVIEDQLPLSINQSNVSCNGANDGILVLNKTGNHNWNYKLVNNSSSIILAGNNINETITISNLFAGAYTLYTEGNTGISDTMNIIITEPAAVVANFSADNETVFLSDAIISFDNTSSNAVSYSWNFGDGNYSDSANTVHEFTSAGTFVVSLTALNSNGCSSSFSKSITVSENIFTGITNFNETSDLNVQQLDGGLQLSLHSSSAKNVVINVYNAFGQLIYNYADKQSGDFSKNVPVNTSGTYIINSIVNNTSHSQKIAILK